MNVNAFLSILNLVYLGCLAWFVGLCLGFGGLLGVRLGIWFLHFGDKPTKKDAQ